MNKLLIISNNVLSEINNNGKTILSFIENSKLEIRQLYFSSEVPSIITYKYFRISDNDIIRGCFFPKKRGKSISVEKHNKTTMEVSLKRKFGRNLITLYIRELLWKNKWQSKQLEEWLDDFRPDVILFVAGDALFAYDICSHIKEKYDSRLVMYTTDDYIMPRLNESVFEKKRRNDIRKQMVKILKKTDVFYTISEQMQKDYKNVFLRNSLIAMNMTDDLMDKSIQKSNDQYIFTYAGTLYYGRDDILVELAKCIHRFNKTHDKKAYLKIFCGTEPEENVLKKINIEGCSRYFGCLTKKELKNQLNKSDVLVFAESFKISQMEKTKYSLSTKIPEYLSVKKPILAIGPDKIGSMQYLQDVAVCVNSVKNLYDSVEYMLEHREFCDLYSCKARDKYEQNHNKESLQREFVENLIG